MSGPGRARGSPLAGLALMAACAWLAPAVAHGVKHGATASSSASATSRSADARSYIEFSDALTADCMVHRAKQRRIANTHPSRAIRVVLVSYTGKTRSQGHIDEVLPADSKPRPLGCDAVGGLDRRWKIVSARFATSDP